MFAARTDMAGSMMRLREVVQRHGEVGTGKFRSTPFCVETCRVVLVSVVS